MADAKIEIKVGAVSFAGEGDGKWVGEQLDKVLSKLHELARVAPAQPDDAGPVPQPVHKKTAGTLAAFLTAKNVKGNKTRKFLATALWIQDTQHKNRLVTRDVTNALSANSQGTVGNATQCLNSNTKRGFCTREGNQFYVTEEGRNSLGQ
ncbi:MAG: hypothetical protein ACRD59_18615 [Candidatus Acidiferrales bacterium]